MGRWEISHVDDFARQRSSEMHILHPRGSLFAMPMEILERMIKALLDNYDDVCDHDYTLNSTRKTIQTLCLVHPRLKQLLYSSYWRQMFVSLQMQHRAYIPGSLPSLL